MDFMGMAGVAAISVIAWLVGESVKLSPLDSKWIPVICGVSGAVLGVLGIAGMWIAVIGDVGVMLLAVLNAMRVLKK